ncbi:MAG: dipeptide/oligopeptide/nickel ABC transporter permease/ATP-binding protein [Chloroflexi bacterium]|nr:dipeptide/oligopeptide/nickel ABC transporter permease/ATP-binding protein [Chloroflexota bacterium]
MIKSAAHRIRQQPPRFQARLWRRPVAVAAASFLIVLTLAALLAPQIAPYDPLAQNLRATLQGPSVEHALGTDHLGRDVLSRVLYGASASLAAAIQAVLIAVVIGVPLGLAAGYFGGWFDRVVSWLIDVLYAIPLLLLAMGLLAVIGAGLANAMLAVGIALSKNFAQLTRAVVLAEREELYVHGAQAVGATVPRILFRHLLPNVAPALIVQIFLTFGNIILIESALSFLGLGVQVGQPSWGTMLAESRVYVRVQPFLPIPPGMAITLSVLAFNLLGDTLRDTFAAGPSVSVGRRRPKPTITASSVPIAPTPSLLEVNGLQVQFMTDDGQRFTVLDDITFDIQPGETFGLVGESGSGKTMTSLAIMGMVPSPGVISSGSICFAERELITMTPHQLQTVRGREIGMVFQESVTALNPVMKIGRQVAAPMRTHLGLSQNAAYERAAELLALVGIPAPRQILDSYPHQLSGGMAQRVAIARAISCQPRLLIADESTSALDVTIQSQILELLMMLREQFDMAMLLISHDLGVIARMCDRTAVMYAGQIVEIAETPDLFAAPRHPYTADLLATRPRTDIGHSAMRVIQGRVPPLHDQPTGCRYHPRCALAEDVCRQAPIALEALDDGRRASRCVRIGALIAAAQPELPSLQPDPQDSATEVLEPKGPRR